MSFHCALGSTIGQISCSKSPLCIRMVRFGLQYLLRHSPQCQACTFRKTVVNATMDIFRKSGMLTSVRCGTDRGNAYAAEAWSPGGVAFHFNPPLPTRADPRQPQSCNIRLGTSDEACWGGAWSRLHSWVGVLFHQLLFCSINRIPLNFNMPKDLPI